MRHLFNAIFLLVFLTCTSCITDWISMEPSVESQVMFRLSFSSETLNHYQIGTRSLIAKTEAESKINNIYIFFFDSNDKLMEISASGIANYSGSTSKYLYIEDTDMVMLNGSYFVDNPHEGDFKSVSVYAFANLDTQAVEGKQSFKDYILAGSTITKDYLLAYEYFPITESNRLFTELPAVGMPMCWCTDEEVFASDNPTVMLKCLMARVDFSISINAEEMTDEYPRIDVQSVNLYNWAKGVTFSPDITKTDSEYIYTTVDESRIDSSRPAISPRTPYNRTFYVFENKQGQIAEKDYNDFFTSSDFSDMSADQLQKLKDNAERYKVDFAGDKPATYFVMEGLYTDQNGFQAKATLKFYLGADNKYDFNVKRNCHYNNVIRITGLTSGDIDSHPITHVLYDSRVNVQGSESMPYYLSVIKANDIDAHIAVIPIDFFIYPNVVSKEIIDGKLVESHISCKSLEVSVQEIDDKGTNWIALEKIPATYMVNGDTPQGNGSTIQYIDAGFPYVAGHCKRKYFVTDMVTDPYTQSGNKNKYGLSRSCVVTGDRDRVYLYVDENLKESSRRANVKVLSTIVKKYGDGREETFTEEKVIEINQRGLLKVIVYQWNSDGSKTEKQTIYIEQIEEYLDNYDPYDNYNSNLIYNGLPWSTKNTGNFTLGSFSSDDTFTGSSVKAYQNYYDGNLGTSSIITNTNDYIMHLNEQPSTAAEYCYNKNKRNAEGRILQTFKEGGWFNDDEWVDGVNEYGWFLPGIRQLESMIVGNYQSFEGYYYWSAATGVSGFKIFGQDVTSESDDRARATKFSHLDDNDVPVFFESDWDNPYEDGKGGSAKRDVSFRIRAAYIPKQ